MSREIIYQKLKPPMYITQNKALAVLQTHERKNTKEIVGFV
jgi:hypothetical protein